MHTAPPPARLPGATPSNRQLAAAGLPVRAPRFNLVRAPKDPYLGTKCTARMGKPAGFRTPHPSDDELEPATTFTAKFKYFHENPKEFSRRVARAYYADELSDEAIDSLHTDSMALNFLHRLSRNCYEDASVPREPRGLVRLHEQLTLDFDLPEGTDINSETTQRGLTARQRELAQNLTAWDDALPPSLFRPAEFEALRVLTAQEDAKHEMLQDALGGSAEDRELDDEIDLQLSANAAAVYTGSGDEGGEDEVIDNLNV